MQVMYSSPSWSTLFRINSLLAGVLINSGLMPLEDARGTRFGYFQSPRSGTMEITLVFLLSFALQVRSELSSTSHFSVDNWTTEHGLPQNSILAFAQTPDGYMWLATWNGLVRFDGVHFSVLNPVNTPELPSARIVDLQTDARGSLWIGSEQDTLTRFAHDRFEIANGQWGLPVGGVYLQDCDPDGNLWVGPRVQGAHYRFAEGGFVPGVTRQTVPESQLQGLKATQGCFWLPKGGHWERYGQPSFRTDLAKRGIDGVRVACPCKKGGIWMLGNSSLYHYPDWHLRKIAGPDLLPDITDMVEDPRGNLWVATIAGLFVIPPGDSAQRVPLGRAGSTQFLRKLFIDIEANVWVGSDVAGLFRVKPRVFRTITQSEGLAGGVIKSLAEDSNGTIWAVHEKGVDCIYPYRLAANGPDPAVSSLFSTDSLWSISLNRSGEAWFGVYNGSVWHWKGGSAKVMDELMGGPGPNIMRVLVPDGNGGTWIGARNGLWKAFGTAERSVPLPANLPSSDVRAIVENSSGPLYIGVHGAGLLRRAGETWTRFGKAQGLADEGVLSLYQDADRVLWIGTVAGSLCRFENEHIINLGPISASLPTLVSCIIEDDLGFLWLGSVDGIYRVSRQALNELASNRRSDAFVHHYGKGQGLETTECAYGMQPTVCKGRDGQLWFATIDGVSVVDPKELASSSRPPPVAIEEILIDDKPAPHSWLVSQTPGDANSSNPEITLPPGNHRLEIRYTALSFTSPETIRFRNRFRNLDHGWNDVGTRRAAYVQGLRPGHYYFDVIACNHDGIWTDKGAGIQLAVLPYFWQTLRFRIIISSAVGGVLIALVHFRLRALEMQRARQQEFSRRLIESQEQERQRIARELHDGLGQDLLLIKNRALLGIEGNGISTRPAQYEAISRTASQALQQVRDISHNLRPYQLDELGLTAALRGIFDRLKDATSVRFQLDLDPVDGIFSASDESHIFRIAQELTNNVLKHSGATEARIEVRLRDQLQIHVSDNGCGFNRNGSARPNSGLGLRGVTERVGILQGKITIASTPGAGTEINISFPLPAARPVSPILSS
jgi:signal transduction histidine kinase/ligand-binding sensor domain-containing protein